MFFTAKNAAKTPQINKRNRLPLSALRCHGDRLSTTILAPFLAVETVGSTPGPKVRPVLAMIAHSRTLVKSDDGPDPALTSRPGFLQFSPTTHSAPLTP